MIQHPDEAGDIVAKAYNLDPAVGRAAVTNPDDQQVNPGHALIGDRGPCTWQVCSA